MLEICAIASGSNGNCYYVGNEKDAVLIDAGISAKQIVQRLKDRNLEPAKIKAIFITHEHSDHMSGARVFGKRMYVPVYITPRTYYGAYKNQRPDVPKFFNPGEKIEVGELTVHSFLKNHDASEPCSFRVQCNGKSIGVFTDIGEPCENVTQHLQMCDGIFLESNYDEKMLWEGSYPWFLKQRVASGVGHLSNKQAFDLLQNHAGENLKCVFLSHLSKENNTPEVALQTMNLLNSRFEVRLTSRYEAAEVFTF
ncbi:MAG TPA: MBL fold metallo-hydrolase [Draconibacterium sp.]|jgi:phosphoribosyl 1,2-cyclic phosphodiesterase|nr:MBL fold metallo-hydrolase [Draconibacterium sp.]